MNADGSGAQKITGELDRDVGDVTWAPDGSGIYFTTQDHGTSNLYWTGLTGGARPVTTGEQMLTNFAMAPKGGATILGVAVRSTYKQPNDIVRVALKGSGRTGDVMQLTHVNEDLLARIKLGEVERVVYTSTSGTKVDGWLVKPPGFDPSRKYPLIMEIHGGPHGAYGVGFNYQFQNFAANGYVVLYTNPRGSTSYGSTFGNAIMHAYPGVDYEDLMAGVDTVVKRGYVDTQSMYVGGCSGGGPASCGSCLGGSFASCPCPASPGGGRPPSFLSSLLPPSLPCEPSGCGGVGTAIKITSHFSTPSWVELVKKSRSAATFRLTISSKPGS